MIVGAGIGGLSAAIGLQRRGWAVTVLERAPRLREVGAGISLRPNALQALDLPGVGDQVRATGAVEAAAGFRDSSGRWLFRSDTDAIERRFGTTVMIRRHDLLEILRAAVSVDAIRSLLR